jgi:hypothetical protein
MDAVAQKDCIAKIRHSNYESEHLVSGCLDCPNAHHAIFGAVIVTFMIPLPP